MRDAEAKRAAMARAAQEKARKAKEDEMKSTMRGNTALMWLDQENRNQANQVEEVAQINKKKFV